MIQLDAAPLTKGFHGRGHVWCASGRRGSRLESLEMRGFFKRCRGVKSSYHSMQLAHNDESATASGSLLKKKKIMIDQATTGQGRGEEN